ncbi:putative bifunctional diguanylate cyclase/phosphodiesterase [Nitrincola sp. MINF-07-Sa-05]|uniref:putative bifunctional diguanylate cyclase/phosphodiesterase n=1 Tax=Nitrincola salilacus TaxID=3400273 RepID=UPI003917CB63
MTLFTESDTSIEQYIHSIGRYYVCATIIMTLLIGTTYQTVKMALDRHALQQEISFLTSQQFIRFQQLSNQTRAVMRASADQRLPEYIIQPMLEDIQKTVIDIREIMVRQEAALTRLYDNLLVRASRSPPSRELYLELNQRLDSFLTRAEKVATASHKERKMRYSFWGPIDFAMSAESNLMKLFNELIQHTHTRSDASISTAASLSMILLLILAAILILAGIFLFYPLLKKLRREYVRKIHVENELTSLAQTDSLTSLSNRAFFNTTLQRLIQRYKDNDSGFSILLIDLDHFKAINDCFGHQAGDAALLHVADALRQVFRSVDTITRIGGDEFAVLLPDICNETQLNAIAKRAIQALSTDCFYGDKKIRTSASIGGALVPMHATDEISLIHIADLALYEAKARRNTAVILDDTTLSTQLKKSELLTALNHAAERDEFIVHYQPKVDIRTGAHLGFEALVRWNHPSLGLLAPGAFLPLMEDSRLIGDMTRSVANNVCRDIKAWKALGLSPGPIAINLPEMLLINDSGIDILDTAIHKNNLDWQDLSVEVTEDVFLDRHADLIQMSMDRFHEHGVSIALDDFGTGFASLSHLRDFPFDELKIDRSFINDIGHDTRSEQIIRAMIDLSRNLGKHCVAEGIETDTQHRFLINAGCAVGQGYLFAKPMAADDVIASWLKPAGKKTFDAPSLQFDLNLMELSPQAD